MSPLTPAFKTLGIRAGDAYHVRRLDACPNKAGRIPEDAHSVRQPKQSGRCSGRRTHVAACTQLAKHLVPNS